MRINFLILIIFFIYSLAFSQKLTCKYTGHSSHQVKSGTVGLEEENGPIVVNGVSVPSDFPHFQAFQKEETAPGYIFLSNWSGTPYILIFKNDGTPYFYQKVEALSIDFKLQNTGFLTRHIRKDFSAFISMDQNYNVIDTFICQNGYVTDEHDIILLDNGNAILIGTESKVVDMSQLVSGGKTNATVTGNHIQEIDKNRNVVFEFNCWENFDITGAVGINLTGQIIDYVHMNSIALDYDSNLLVTSRHLSECTKINRKTGKIIWRLGGKYNQFKLINDDVMIDYPHNIQPVPGMPGNYTIFDNGNNRGYTRVVEYKIDTDSMTAAKVWQYLPSPDKFTQTMGNAQRLPNGNTLINWSDANYPKATEVNPNGDIIFEGDFVSPTACYRAFRFQWNGFLQQPYLIVEPLHEKTRLIFNQFGKDDIAEYKVYAGTTPDTFNFIATTSNTWMDLSNLQINTNYYFKVTSVDLNGKESDFSNLDSTFTRYSVPGYNLVRNGDFTEGTKHWEFFLFGNAQAEAIVNADTQMVFNINEGSTLEVGVQFRQNQVPLIKGKKYIFEFDAWAENSRNILAKVGMDAMPYTNYSKIGTTAITNEMKRYTFQFIMNEATDLNSRVVFNSGTSNLDVIIDNVALYIKKEEEDTNATQILISNKGIAHFNVFPNPLQNQLNIQYHIQNSGTVLIQLFDAIGTQVFYKKAEIMPDIDNIINMDIKGLNQGIYICSFEFTPDGGGEKVLLYSKILKAGD